MCKAVVMVHLSACLIHHTVLHFEDQWSPPQLLPFGEPIPLDGYHIESLCVFDHILLPTSQSGVCYYSSIKGEGTETQRGEETCSKWERSDCNPGHLTPKCCRALSPNITGDHYTKKGIHSLPLHPILLSTASVYTYSTRFQSWLFYGSFLGKSSG